MIDNKTRTIAIEWCIDDVQEVRPDLTNDQAWEVLKSVEKNHNAEVGVSWQTLEVIAEILYPEEDAA